MANQLTNATASVLQQPPTNIWSSAPLFANMLYGFSRVTCVRLACALNSSLEMHMSPKRSSKVTMGYHVRFPLWRLIAL
eukprot:2950325-Amphidinium_carterae.1